MFLEIFVPAHFGSVLIENTGNLYNDVYKCNWYELSDDFKRSMSILVAKTLQPMAIQSAGIFQLDLISMLKVN